jgi:hypothetical protein
MKEQLDRIEAKLDRVIKALQEYDGLDEDFNEPEDEYAWENINSTAAEEYNRLFNEEEANKRIDIIGQNGNEGLHYDMEELSKAVDEWSKKRVKGTKEYLKDATLNIIPDFQHTPPPPAKPKKKYYHNKNKKDGNKKSS